MAPPKAITLDTIEFVVPKGSYPGQKLLRMARDGRLIWVTIPDDAVVGKSVVIKIDPQVPQSHIRYSELVTAKDEYMTKLGQWKAQRSGARASSDPKSFSLPRPVPPSYYPIPTIGPPID